MAKKAKSQTRRTKKKRETTRQLQPKNKRSSFLEKLQIEINDNDVVCGRGWAGLNNPGNEKYHQLIKYWIDVFYCGNNEMKTPACDVIVNEIVRNGGRFIRLDAKKETWRILPYDKVRAKIGQTFRDVKNRGYYEDEKKETVIAAANKSKEDVLMKIEILRKNAIKNEPQDAVQTTTIHPHSSGSASSKTSIMLPSSVPAKVPEKTAIASISSNEYIKVKDTIIPLVPSEVAKKKTTTKAMKALKKKRTTPFPQAWMSTLSVPQVWPNKSRSRKFSDDQQSLKAERVLSESVRDADKMLKAPPKKTVSRKKKPVVISASDLAAFDVKMSASKLSSKESISSPPKKLIAAHALRSFAAKKTTMNVSVDVPGKIKLSQKFRGKVLNYEAVDDTTSAPMDCEENSSPNDVMQIQYLYKQIDHEGSSSGLLIDGRKENEFKEPYVPLTPPPLPELLLSPSKLFSVSSLPPEMDLSKPIEDPDALSKKLIRAPLVMSPKRSFPTTYQTDSSLVGDALSPIPKSAFSNNNSKHFDVSPSLESLTSANSFISVRNDEDTNWKALPKCQLSPRAATMQQEQKDDILPMSDTEWKTLLDSYNSPKATIVSDRIIV